MEQTPWEGLRQKTRSVILPQRFLIVEVQRTPLRENVLGNNSSIAVPRAHRKLSTYFGPPSTDSIRDSGKNCKGEVVECGNKKLQSLASMLTLGGSAGHSHEQRVKHV